MIFSAQKFARVTTGGIGFQPQVEIQLDCGTVRYRCSRFDTGNCFGSDVLTEAELQARLELVYETVRICFAERASRSEAPLVASCSHKSFVCHSSRFSNNGAGHRQTQL
uniref:Uncharacterized protein n=1 Tax=Physcomitrium patens TaxID=3218 RepID=A9TL40_PHYPA|nr:hypothetical protein PHYPA_030322 [Physcomitrium patens]